MTEIKPEISYVSPNEMEESKNRITSIRFDCLVKMVDFAQRETKGGLSFTPKHLPPQWFKSELRLTLESVADADPYTLGMYIKEAYLKLKQHIELYENNL